MKKTGSITITTSPSPANCSVNWQRIFDRLWFCSLCLLFGLCLRVALLSMRLLGLPSLRDTKEMEHFKVAPTAIHLFISTCQLNFIIPIFFQQDSWYSEQNVGQQLAHRVALYKYKRTNNGGVIPESKPHPQ